MATIQALNYSVPGGNALRAGLFDAGVFGGATLDAVVATGILGSNIATTSGSILLDSVLPTGTVQGKIWPDASLDLLAAAPVESWVQLNAGQNTMQSVFAPTGLTSQLGPGGQPRIQGAWPSFAWSPSRHSLIIWGGGHANSPTGQVFEWSAATRQWTLAYHQADLLSMGGSGQYRSVDFNSTPVASHTYGNNNWLTVLGRFWTFGGAAFNTGGPLAVWDPLNDGQQGFGLRTAGAYTLDMTQAGTGKVAGATGSNVKGIGYTDVNLTGANSWQLRDWFGQTTSHPSRPRTGGIDYGEHINCGTAHAVEAGKDVIYYTASSGGGRHLWKVSIDADPLNDVQTYIASQGVDNQTNGNQGPIALDPVRRLVVLCNGSNKTSSTTVQFVDLKRTWGGTNSWRWATLTGADLAEFLAMSPDLANAGILYNPIKSCFTIYNMGRQVWEIYPPNSAAYVDNSNANLTSDTGWTLVKPVMDVGGLAPRSNYIGPGSPEQETGLLGKWRWAPDLRCGITTFGNSIGEVWAYKTTGWVDPRI